MKDNEQLPEDERDALLGPGGQVLANGQAWFQGQTEGHCMFYPKIPKCLNGYELSPKSLRLSDGHSILILCILDCKGTPGKHYHIQIS